MRWIIAFVLCIQAAAAWADTESLAIESYRHMLAYEDRLSAAIRSEDRGDFTRFIYHPTAQLMQRWPKLSDMDQRYLRCYFALDGFRIYSEDQFAARGALPKNKGQAKDYFEQKAACKASLRGKI